MIPNSSHVQLVAMKLNRQQFPGLLYPYVKLKVKPDKDKFIEKLNPKAAS